MTAVPRRLQVAVAVAGVAALVAACGSEGGGGGGDGDDPLVVWTLENLPDRLEVQEEIAAAFTESSGVEVDLVAIDENQFNQLLTSSAAAGELPDAIGALSLAGVQALSTNELLDPDTAGAVIEDLGADTFSERALELPRDGDTQLSVPSDGWAQLLVYRQDLFDAAGLDAPETYEDILAAADALDNPEVAGFVGATCPTTRSPQQTFEHLALGKLVLVIVVLPILWTVMLAFQDLRLIRLRTAGLFGDYTVDNFVDVFTSPGFWGSPTSCCRTRPGCGPRCRNSPRPPTARCSSPPTTAVRGSWGSCGTAG